MSAVGSGHWGSNLQWPGLSVLCRPSPGSLSSRSKCFSDENFRFILCSIVLCPTMQACWFDFLPPNTQSAWNWSLQMKFLDIYDNSEATKFRIRWFSVHNQQFNHPHEFFLLLFILAYLIATPGGIFMPSIMASVFSFISWSAFSSFLFSVFQ